MSLKSLTIIDNHLLKYRMYHFDLERQTNDQHESHTSLSSRIDLDSRLLFIKQKAK